MRTSLIWICYGLSILFFVAGRVKGFDVTDSDSMIYLCVAWGAALIFWAFGALISEGWWRRRRPGVKPSGDKLLRKVYEGNGTAPAPEERGQTEDTVRDLSVDPQATNEEGPA